MKFHPASYLTMRDFYFKIFWMQMVSDLSLRSRKFNDEALETQTSRVRLRVRTPPFHGGDTGSNPVRGTKASQFAGLLYFQFQIFTNPVQNQ